MDSFDRTRRWVGFIFFYSGQRWLLSQVVQPSVNVLARRNRLSCLWPRIGSIAFIKSTAHTSPWNKPQGLTHSCRHTHTHTPAESVQVWSKVLTMARSDIGRVELMSSESRSHETIDSFRRKDVDLEARRINRWRRQKIQGTRFLGSQQSKIPSSVLNVLVHSKQEIDSKSGKK